MVLYADGTVAHAGDFIEIDNGQRYGRVLVVIDNENLLREWGVDSPGLMVESEYYGLLFVQVSRIEEMGCKPRPVPPENEMR